MGKFIKGKAIQIMYFIFLLFPLHLAAQELLLFNESNSPLIPQDLRCIAVDSSNSKWIGSVGNLFKFNNSWQTIDSVLELTGSYWISDIEIAKNGTIWTSIATSLTDSIVTKLYFRTGSRWEKIHYDFGLRDPVNIYPENDSTLYFTLINNWPNQLGDDEIGIYENHSVIINNPAAIWGISYSVPLLGDTLLVRDWNGIQLFDGSNWQLKNPKGWVPEAIKKIGADVFVFGKKLSKLKNGDYISYSSLDSVLSADSLIITAITKEDENILWIGTNKGILIKYWTRIKLFDVTSKPIVDIAVDKDKNKWFIGEEGCFEFNENGITKVEKAETHPLNFQLYQNYPNPFNPGTIIEYSVPAVETGYVSLVQLKIYDILGREVAALVNKKQNSGNYKINFNAKNLRSGIYLYRLIINNFSKTRKMVLIK